jgi:hypothetical protein
MITINQIPNLMSSADVAFFDPGHLVFKYLEQPEARDRPRHDFHRRFSQN